MAEAITIKELAKELDLAVSTVSRALRDSYEISTKTKMRVNLLAEKLNYKPNPYAGSLRLKRSKTIAVIIPEITNHFFSSVVDGIGAISNEREYHTLIYFTHENFIKEVATLKLLQTGRVDGILMSLSKYTKNFKHIFEITKKNIPIVFFDRVCNEIDTPSVTSNNYEGGYKATKHLLERGCKNIVYLSNSPNLDISQKRAQGYKKALQHSAIKYDSRKIIQCNDDKDNYSLIYNLLKEIKDRPDGIFASIEKLAITTYQVCNDLNLDIPKQLKIICFANLETAPLLAPSLTTITQPAYDIGKEATKLLVNLIEDRYIFPSDKHLTLPTTLIARRSTQLSQ